MFSSPRKRGGVDDFENKPSFKTGIFGQPEAKVHLGQAWRIEFSYKDIGNYLARLKGRVREAASQTGTFNRAQ